MKAIKIAEKISLVDPMIDPPAPINRAERRLLSTHQLRGQIGGALGGVLLGAGLGYALRNADPDRMKKFHPDWNPGTLLKGGIITGGVGGLLGGSALGTYSGNRAILKQRLKATGVLHPEEEEEHFDHSPQYPQSAITKKLGMK